METEKKIIGRCPLCGGNVVKTCKGYRCEHNIGEQPTCKLNINAIIGNRKMADNEIAEILEKRSVMLDGFSSKEGKTFPTVLVLADDGSVQMQPVIGKCPHCGGDIRCKASAESSLLELCRAAARVRWKQIRVGNRAFNCTNYKDEANPCKFSVWRNIGGHQLTLDEAKEICEKGMTTDELEMYRDDGAIYHKRLGLSPDKLQIIKI